MLTTLHFYHYLKLLAIAKNPKYIENNMNTEISKITTWLKSNMLEKSKFIIFLKHPKKLSNLNITVNNKIIEQVDHFIYHYSL